VERNYWVRTEHGRVWGPYSISALERLRGQLTEKCEASTDGKEWHPGADFPELRSLLVPARKIERQTAAPAAGPRISKAMAEAFGVGGTPSDSTQAQGAPAAIAPATKTAHGVAKGPSVIVPVIAKGPPVIARGPPAVAKGPPEAPGSPPVMAKAPPPPPPAPEQLAVPESGDLAELSPARVYALLALNSGSGALQLELDKGRMLQISFRRGTPEHLSCDDPELSLLRFLQSKAMVAAAIRGRGGTRLDDALQQERLLLFNADTGCWLRQRRVFGDRKDRSCSRHQASDTGSLWVGASQRLLQPLMPVTSEGRCTQGELEKQGLM